MPRITLRFASPLETEFRAHYIRTFIGPMRMIWGLALLFWVLGWLADPAVFPAEAKAILPIRIVVAVWMVGTIAAMFFPQHTGRALHGLAMMSAIFVGVGSSFLMTFVAYPANYTFYITVLTVTVVTCAFMSVLRFDYTVYACLAIGLVFLTHIFFVVPTPLALAFRSGLSLFALASVGLFCNFITERYARENFLQQRTLAEQAAAIAEKVSELEVSERKALDANRAKSVFLSNMSHELRTPLNAVLGFAQLMNRSRTMSNDDRDNLGVIMRSSEHLLELINDVLAISKIEAGKIQFVQQPFDLGHLLHDVAEMIRVRTRQKGLQLIVDIAPGMPAAVLGDESKVRQVLLNLLGNAVKFTAEGGIGLHVRWHEDHATLEITDTGHGIAPEEMDKLFKPFAQTESGRMASEGTGLGLAISHNFITRMGGAIRVNSSLGQGTVFTVDLPLTATELSTHATEAKRAIGLAPGQPVYRILVVDDIEENRVLLERLLETVGLDVRQAVNGREAVEQWENWKPHLIWMDIRMPVMNGIEATKQIRMLEGDEPASRTVIIALTASAFLHDRDEILVSGCDDFVTKPFRESSIFEKMVEHLGAEFTHEAAACAETRPETTVSEGITPARIAALPATLHGELQRALVVGDAEEASEIIARIEPLDPPLAHDLRQAVRGYRFDELLEMFGEVGL